MSDEKKQPREPEVHHGTIRKPPPQTAVDWRRLDNLPGMVRLLGAQPGKLDRKPCSTATT